MSAIAEWQVVMQNLQMSEDEDRVWEVRRANEADFPIWGRMLASLHPNVPPDELLRELEGLVTLQQPYVAFLAFDRSGQPVGVVDARLRNYAEGSPELRGAYLEDLWVEPEVRHQGVARTLLAAVEDWACAQGLQWLGSDTSPDNRASRDWHVAVGFAEVEHLVVFGKSLR